MSDRSSAGSAGSTSASTAPGTGTCSSASPTPTGERCSPPGSQESPSTTTYAQSLSENQRGEMLLTDVAHQITTGGGKPGQGYQAVLISSPAEHPAKTSASPDNAADSTANGQDFSSNTPGSLTLFDPDGFSGRTFQVRSLQTAVGTSEQCLERWPTSGTAWPGGFSTAVGSTCRSDESGCSSSAISLTAILEPPQNVPARYSLSARAARGILRRAAKRGKKLPGHLEAALASVAGPRTPSA